MFWYFRWTVQTILRKELKEGTAVLFLCLFPIIKLCVVNELHGMRTENNHAGRMPLQVWHMHTPMMISAHILLFVVIRLANPSSCGGGCWLDILGRLQSVFRSFTCPEKCDAVGTADYLSLFTCYTTQYYIENADAMRKYFSKALNNRNNEAKLFINRN